MTGEMHIHSTKKSCETVAETKQQKKCFCQKKVGWNICQIQNVGMVLLKFSRLQRTYKPWVVSSTFQIVQILFHSHFDLVSSPLALEATEPVSEPVTEMALELINNHLIEVQEKR